jgi:hypothetical protein
MFGMETPVSRNAGLYPMGWRTVKETDNAKSQRLGASEASARRAFPTDLVLASGFRHPECAQYRRLAVDRA